MTKQDFRPVFGAAWLEKARDNNNVTSWAGQVIETLQGPGRNYLDTLCRWLSEFPATSAEKRQLHRRLESFENYQHIGAVNELCWWFFMRRCRLDQEVVATVKNEARPDFLLLEPTACYIEVSTLNVSEKDHSDLEQSQSVALNHTETLRRLIGKSNDEEKLRQFKYAAKQEKPCVLVIFDYTEWSKYGTGFSSYIERALSWNDTARELSAIIYVERKVLDGQCAISLKRLAICLNPLATYPLSHSLDLLRVQPTLGEDNCTEGWFYL